MLEVKKNVFFHHCAIENFNHRSHLVTFAKRDLECFLV